MIGSEAVGFSRNKSGISPTYRTSRTCRLALSAAKPNVARCVADNVRRLALSLARPLQAKNARQCRAFVQGLSRPSGRRARRFDLLPRALLERLAHVRDQKIDFGLVDEEVRREAQRVGAAVDHVDAAFAHVFLDRVRAEALELVAELAREQEAGALHLGDQAAELVLQR